MKKLIAAVLTAALLTLGLVEFSGGAALAKGPYNVRPVKVVIHAPKAPPPHSDQKVTVKPTKGAKGTTTIIIHTPWGGTRVVQGTSFTLGNVRRGVYTIVVKFKAKKNTAWKDSTKTFKITIK